MKLLFENWRKYLTEAELEESRVRDIGQIATGIARELFGEIKRIMKRHPPDALAEDIFEKYKGYDGPYRVNIRRRGLMGPTQQDRLWLNFTIMAVTPTSSTGGKVFWINAGYASWEYQKKKKPYSKEEGLDYLKIGFRVIAALTKEDIEKQYQNIYMNLLETISHELEHGSQFERGEDDAITGRDNYIEYLYQPHEIEAYARGIYTLAVKSKVSFESLVDEAAAHSEKFCEFSKIHNCTQSEIKKWKTLLMDYAEKQLPCAQDISGQPLNPKCDKPPPTTFKRLTLDAQKKVKHLFNSAIWRFKKQSQGKKK